jgi:hypothetical protein
MRTVAVLAGLLLLPGAALVADDGPSDPNAVMEPAATVTAGSMDEAAIDTFGTSSNTWMSLPAWDALPIDSSFTYNYTNASTGIQGITRSNTAGNPWVEVPFHLPNGAAITKVAVNYCDTGAETLNVFLVRQGINSPNQFVTLITSSGTPGCIVETATLATPMTVANGQNTYHLEVNMGTGTAGTIILASIHVGYVLQVSPAPSTASFPNDVPTTHPFFKYIEALKASGITGGCAAGSFCPDAPVTRGQMAVFLATALGLHFPN